MAPAVAAAEPGLVLLRDREEPLLPGDDDGDDPDHPSGDASDAEAPLLPSEEDDFRRRRASIRDAATPPTAVEGFVVVAGGGVEKARPRAGDAQGLQQGGRVGLRVLRPRLLGAKGSWERRRPAVRVQGGVAAFEGALLQRRSRRARVAQTSFDRRESVRHRHRQQGVPGHGLRAAGHVGGRAQTLRAQRSHGPERRRRAGGGSRPRALANGHPSRRQTHQRPRRRRRPPSAVGLRLGGLRRQVPHGRQDLRRHSRLFIAGTSARRGVRPRRRLVVLRLSLLRAFHRQNALCLAHLPRPLRRHLARRPRPPRDPLPRSAASPREAPRQERRHAPRRLR
mmetsp:Transcript_20755/g.64118  ORF Transcript_20755/g.64118 Transcript_20755/m.64118 type:complete len:338 (-) Transcript_20755:22-1035(-)